MSVPAGAHHADVDPCEGASEQAGAKAMAGKVNELASLPGACVRVMELANDPMASVHDIAEVIKYDPGLTARTLKIVNSVCYCPSARIDTVAGAVHALGTDGVRNLAIAAGAIAALDKMSSDLPDINFFWSASVRCALASRALSGIAVGANSELGFVVGLLHAVGQLVLCRERPDQAIRLRERMGMGAEASAALERDIFGFTSAQVGAALLTHWRLPASVVSPVRFQLSPLEARAYPVQAAILYIASTLTASGEGIDDLLATAAAGVDDVTPAVWRAAGLTAAVVPNVVDEIDEHWFEVIEILFPGRLLIGY